MGRDSSELYTSGDEASSLGPNLARARCRPAGSAVPVAARPPMDELRRVTRWRRFLAIVPDVRPSKPLTIVLNWQ
jgi:hypothetical protein